MRRARTPSLAAQAFALRGRFPEGRVQLRGGRLIWTGRIHPTPLSRAYLVQVDYRDGRIPEVRVLDSLDGRDGEALPHVYEGGTLCLHLPGEWTSDMLLVDSTVPWTAEWLINYEIWRATGEWYGGGEWPPRRERAEAKPPAPDEEKSTAPPISEGRWEVEMAYRGRGRGFA